MFRGCPAEDYAIHTARGLPSEDLAGLGAQSLGLVAGWLALFYGAAALAGPLRRVLPPSSAPAENSAYWVAWNICALVQSSVIPLLGVHALVSDELLRRPLGEQLSNQGQLAFAGLLFTTFEVADLLIMSVHDFGLRTLGAHHCVFITLGLFMRLDCYGAVYAAALMAQELSNPVLTLACFFHHRGPPAWLVWVLRALFLLAFGVFRLGLNTWATWRFFEGWGAGFIPDHVPAWRRCVVGGALVAGAALQWAWAAMMAAAVASGRSIDVELSKNLAQTLEPLRRKRKDE